MVQSFYVYSVCFVDRDRKLIAIVKNILSVIQEKLNLVKSFESKDMFDIYNYLALFYSRYVLKIKKNIKKYAFGFDFDMLA